MVSSNLELTEFMTPSRQLRIDSTMGLSEVLGLPSMSVQIYSRMQNCAESIHTPVILVCAASSVAARYDEQRVPDVGE